MKKIVLLAGLALSLGFATKSDAQVRINVNIGNPMPVMQQSWYGSDADYYYMPDQGVYYNVNRRMYVWPNGGNWLCGPSLPQSYGACTWGNSRYYSFRGRSPFMRNDYYRNRYGMRGNSGRGGYAYRNDRGYDGRRGGGWDNNRGGGRWNDNRQGGGWNDGRRGGDDRGGRGYGNGGGRGGDRNYGNNNGGGYNGNGGNGYNGNGGNGGGNNNGGNNGGGRGGWDRR